MAKFYVSDLHFGHKNILGFDNRPFFNVSEMDEALITNWNNQISDDDTVYVLGDISWLTSEETVEILKRLNGKKVLIKGNHDRVSPQMAREFIGVHDYLEIKDNDTKIILSHYPMPFWNGQFNDTIHLYGHTHISHQWHMCERWAEEARQLQAIPMRMINVGCMMPWMNYTPQTLDTILKGYDEFLKKQRDARERFSDSSEASSR